MKRQVRHLTLVLIALCLFAQGAKADINPTNDVIYVKQGASGTGLSWADAANLSVALEAATPGTEIWVAAGEYKPTTLLDQNDARTATFYIPMYVSVYGGFAGGESTREARDWKTNETILSGDIGTKDDAADNAYHVVYIDGGTLDGCTVTGGKADNESENEWNRNKFGGGVFVNLGTLLNSTIHGNTADGNGAGVYSTGQGQLTMEKNTIYDNHAGGKGGGVCYGDGKAIDNEIYGNTAAQGGGIYVSTGGSASLLNNSIYANTATTGNGGGDIS